jgi:protein tyrosine/serine phosphatase
MTVHLLSASDMGPNPQEFYTVAKAPGLLAGMSYPYKTQWQSLHVAGFRYIVCLTDEIPTYDPAPLIVLYTAKLQDLAGGSNPRQPDHEERCIRDAVSLIIPRVLAGEGVAVHCVGGTGRTGTVIACSLKALGLRPGVVIAHMKMVNAARTKRKGWEGWPESLWQRALFDRF